MRPEEDGSPTTPTILVVEDDADTREFIVMLLSSAGYATLEAASGAAALTTMATHPARAILLDLRLPDMDGLAVCRYLRANGYPTVPILLVTAERRPLLDRNVANAGATGLLSKPFAPDALLEQLMRLVPS